MALIFGGGGTGDSRLSGSILPVGSVAITVNPTDNEVVPITTANPTLTPPTGFVLEAGYAIEDIQDRNNHFTIVNGELQLQNLSAGSDYYIIGDGFLSASHSANNSTVGLVFGFTRSGSTTLTPRVVVAKFPNQGDIGTLSGGGMIGDDGSQFYLQNGDKVGVYIGSDNTGTVNIDASNLHLTLYKHVD